VTAARAGADDARPAVTRRQGLQPVLHLLLLGTPRLFAFFASITALADAIAAAAPFTQPAPLASKVFTAIINIIVGVAVISLLSGVGRSAARPVGRAEPGRTDDYSPGRQHLAAPCDGMP
jgi:hypothetical protein